MGFVETGFSYNFAPFCDFFSPGASSVFHFSYGSRPDIGISNYEYITDRFTLQPSLTILSSFKLYPGLGVEKFHLLRHTYDDTCNTSEIKDETQPYAFASIKAEIDRYIIFLHPAFQRSATLSYSYYKNISGSFHEIDLSAKYDFSAHNLDIFSLALSGMRIMGDCPFYHEESVSGGVFRGFTGKGYYSKKIIKGEAEYKTSIHRGYIFVGPFIDGVIFQSENSDIPLHSRGICGGLSGHVIFFDQFEFSGYFGKDYLFSNGSSAYNLTFSIEKNY